MSETERTSTLELRDYFRILSVRKWTAIFVFIAVVGGVMFLSYREKNVYQSGTEVLVPGDVESISSSGQLVYGKPDLGTEAAIAGSTEIAVSVAKELGYDSTDPRVINHLLKNIQVGAAQKTTAILEFKATAPTAPLAQSIAEDFSTQYLAFKRGQSAATLRTQAATIQGQIAGYVAQLTKLQSEPPSTERDTTITNIESDLSSARTQLTQIQTGIQTINQSNGSILKHAPLPTSPSSPNHIRDGLLAAIVGLVLGFGAAFLRDYVDDSLRGVDDVERQSGTTLIGVIPHVAGANLDNPPKAKRKKGEAEIPAPAAYLVSRQDPKAPATEAYRTLRTNLLFMSATGPLKVVLVTSPLQGEGKTTTSANLAVVMAQAGQRVLLVGSDLRRPSIHRLFGISNRTGLSSVLAGQTSLAEAVQDPGITGLRVLPSGPVPPNPAEILGSPKMRSMIEEMANAADWVILDGPPALGLADALVLSTVSDGVLMVVNEATNRRILAHARDQLAKVHARPAGAVLNNFGPTFGYYYSDYYLYTSSYYQQPEPEHVSMSRRDRKREARRAADEAERIASSSVVVEDRPSEPRVAQQRAVNDPGIEGNSSGSSGDDFFFSN